MPKDLACCNKINKNNKRDKEIGGDGVPVQKNKTKQIIPPSKGHKI